MKFFKFKRFLIARLSQQVHPRGEFLCGFQSPDFKNKITKLVTISFCHQLHVPTLKDDGPRSLCVLFRRSTRCLGRRFM